MVGNGERRETESRGGGGGGGDGEESVGGPMCWKTKGSEDESSSGERAEDEARLKCLLM